MDTIPLVLGITAAKMKRPTSPPHIPPFHHCFKHIIDDTQHFLIFILWSELIQPFPEDFPTPPAAKKTALNTMFTLGFRYIPGGVGGGR